MTKAAEAVHTHPPMPLPQHSTSKTRQWLVAGGGMLAILGIGLGALWPRETEPRDPMVALWAYGFAGEEPGHLSAPLGVDIDDRGRTWASDPKRGVVVVYSDDGAVVGEIDTASLDLTNYWAIWTGVDARGRAHLVDGGRAQVVVVNADGEFVDRYGVRGAGPGELLSPSGIAFDRYGRAHITDRERARVIVFDQAGVFVTEYGSPNGSNSGLEYPVGIAFDSQGRAHVVDSFAHQIFVYDSDGRPILVYGTPGTGPGQLNFPGAIDIDAQDRAHVIDEHGSIISVYSPDGAHQFDYGPEGYDDRWMLAAHDITIDKTGHAHIVTGAYMAGHPNYETYGRPGLIQVFGPPTQDPQTDCITVCAELPPPPPPDDTTPTIPYPRNP